MAKRIIIGSKGADVGMWISAPGKSADSAVFEDLLVDTTRINTQPIWKTYISNPTLNYNSGLSYDVAFAYAQIGSNVGFWGSQEGLATFTYDIQHNLGYIPLCHMSVGSNNAGEPYPSIFIDANKIRLQHSESVAFQNLSRPGSLYFVASEVPNSVTFTADFHIVLFRQSL